MANEQKVIATAGLVAVAVGSANSMVKFHKPPSTRFLIGSGIAFLTFSAMASVDALGELAKGLAVGIMSTIVLGEGGGVMSYFVGKQEMDTRKPGTTHTTDSGGNTSTPAPRNAESTHLASHMTVPLAGTGFRRDAVPSQPFFSGRVRP